MKQYVMACVAALGLGACETNNVPQDEVDSGSPDTDVVDPPLEPEYFAVLLDDSVQFPEHRTDGGDPCATSAANAHGADIDAIELLDSDGVTSLGTLASSVYHPATLCDDTAFTDPEEAESVPDGSLNDGFVSLAGGGLSGEFPASLELLAGYIIKVYEIDDAFCGGSPSCVGSEKYSVYITSELDCGKDDPDCDVLLISDEGDGSGSFVVPAL